MNYFENVSGVKYEGPDSTNPLSFKYYNPEEMINGKKMEDLMRFAVSYWHTFTAEGNDPFGEGTMIRSYDRFSGMDLAKARVEASFEFYEKLNVPFFCFHDADIAPEGDSLRETFKNLDVITGMIKDYMKSSKTKLLWNTANMFSHPRWSHGAATAPNADVFAYLYDKGEKGT